MPYERLNYLDSPTDPDARIWRYMDFPKLLSILVNRTLFFPSAKKLSESDTFEGQPTYAELEALESEVGHSKKQAIVEAESGNMSFVASRCFFNCWHMNDVESDAMWKIYVNGTGGVAIQSTVKRLKDALACSTEPIYLGRIMYIDFNNDIGPPESYLRKLMRKNKAFEHEKELRAVFYDQRQDHVGRLGVSIQTDVNSLIETIVIAPRAEEWFFELVETLVKKLHYTIPVKRSALICPISLQLDKRRSM